MPTDADVYASRGYIYDSNNDGKVAGTSGNDTIIAPNAPGVDYMYGGAGNDTFIFKASSFDSSDAAPGVDKIIFDFQGAGGWSATNNDFIALTGFGAGSTLTLDTNRGVGGQANNPGGMGALYYYDLHDTTTGNDYTILIHSVNGALLGAGDYHFY